MFTEAYRREFEQNGYAIARGLFSTEEVTELIDHYMSIRDRGGDGWAEGGIDPTSDDPFETISSFDAAAPGR